MGALFSRVGSDPYYASYERSFEHINKEKTRLQQVLAIRAQQQRTLKTRFLTFSVPMAVIAFAWAAWVRQQPVGTYTSQEHFVRMLPVFLVPASAYGLYVALSWVLRWVEIRDRARLTGLQAKLKKMLNELKDSTRYQKTFQLLQKFDPDFQPPTPAPAMLTPGPRGGRLRHMQSAPGSPSTPIMQGLRAGPINSPIPPSTARPKANNFVLSALDHLANVTMGSDPVLVSAVREAKQQAEKLREQLQASEMLAAKLKEDNAALRARLKEDEQAAPDVHTELGISLSGAGESDLAVCTAPAASTMALPGPDPPPPGNTQATIKLKELHRKKLKRDSEEVVKSFHTAGSDDEKRELRKQVTELQKELDGRTEDLRVALEHHKRVSKYEEEVGKFCEYLSQREAEDQAAFNRQTNLLNQANYTREQLSIRLKEKADEQDASSAACVELEKRLRDEGAAHESASSEYQDSIKNLDGQLVAMRERIASLEDNLANTTATVDRTNEALQDAHAQHDLMQDLQHTTEKAKLGLKGDIMSLQHRQAELADELEEAVAARDQAQEVNESLIKQLGDAEDHRAARDNDVAIMRKAMAAQQASMNQLSVEKEAIQAQLASAQQTVQQLEPLKAQLAEQRAQTERLKEKEIETGSMLKDMRQQHADMQSELQASSQKLEDLMDLKIQLKEANERIITLEAEVAAVEAGQAQTCLRQAENQVASSRQESETAKKALDDALQQACDARSKASAAERQLDIVRHELQAQQKQLQHLREQQSQQDLSASSAELDILRAEVTAAAAKLSQLNEQHNAKLGETVKLNDKVMSQQQDLVIAAQQQTEQQALQAELQAARSAQEHVQADLRASLERANQDSQQQQATNVQQLAELTELRRQIHYLRTGKGPAARRDSGMATSPGDPEQDEPLAAHAEDAAHSGGASMAHVGLPQPAQSSPPPARTSFAPGRRTLAHGTEASSYQAAGSAALEVVKEHIIAPAINQAAQPCGPQPIVQGSTDDDTNGGSHSDQHLGDERSGKDVSQATLSSQRLPAEGQAGRSHTQSIPQAPSAKAGLSPKVEKRITRTTSRTTSRAPSASVQPARSTVSTRSKAISKSKAPQKKRAAVSGVTATQDPSAGPAIDLPQPGHSHSGTTSIAARVRRQHVKEHRGE
ncbi:hypothetical protein WJX74_004808 [Apatococcus lobatus]|uniref:Uncharacterized protein n=1 Tax=Apatococcus lobatus TaxID=904363 RepID=A0AAW1SBK3_9CHLO